MNSDFLLLGGTIAAFFLLFLPRFLLSGNLWLSRFHFTRTHPEKAWLIDTYIFLLVIWLFISVILTARYFQMQPFPVFTVFTVFIPIVGVGLLKGIIEIVFGISSRLALKKRRSHPFVRLKVMNNWEYLTAFEYKFSINPAQIRRVGFVRVAVNLSVLAGLVYFYNEVL